MASADLSGPSPEHPGRFPVTSLGRGFAAAVHPVTSQTVATDAQGLNAGEVRIPTGDEEIPAYRARPGKSGTFPVVLVVQEIFGVHEYIKDVCRRFAKLDYCAIAVEMFARQGDVSKLLDIQDIRKVVAQVPDAQAMSDLDAAAAWAVHESNGDPTRLLITGFCWGGRIAWLYAAHNPALKAAGAWYGRLEGDRTQLTPQHPIDVAGALQAPVLGLYGGQDNGIPLDSVERMRASLKAAGSPSAILVYPDAQHAFHADYRPNYNPEAANDGWEKLLSWFRKYGD